LAFSIFLISATCESAEVKAQNSEDFGEKVKVSNTFTVTNKEEWEAAIEAIKGGGNDQSYVINVIKDVTDIDGFAYEKDDPIYTFGDVTGLKVSLRGSGSLTLGSNGRILWMNAGQSLILRDLALSGKSVSDVIDITENAEFFMHGGTISSGESGVRAHGSFTMTGGSITGNTWYGVTGSGNFTMSGGTISGNSHEVLVFGGGSFTMSGGSISDNSEQGVRVADGGSFTMTGGSISGNGNSGVHVYEGSFAMSGGSITNNTVNFENSFFSAGGGVSIVFGSFVKTGGTISGNAAANDLLGHQVFYNPTFTASRDRGIPFGYYRDTDLGEGDNLSTDDLNSGWEGRRR
jgi:hypothetical protein